MKPATIKPHPATNTISVVNSFWRPENVTFKFRAPYEKWAEWYRTACQNVSVRSVLEHVSRPKMVYFVELERWAYDMPENFLWEFYKKFVVPAKYFNPLLSKQSRRLFHGVHPLEFRTVVISARWLYVFFQHWKNRSQREWPEELVNFAGRKNIILLPRSNTASITLDALTTIFAMDFGDYDNFYRDHIRSKDIPAIRSVMKHHHQFLPIEHHLQVCLSNLSPAEIFKALLYDPLNFSQM